MDTGKRIILDEEHATPTAPTPPQRRTELEASALPLPEEGTAPASPLPQAADGGKRTGESKPLLLAGLALAGTLLFFQTIAALFDLVRESPFLGAAWTVAFVLIAGAGTSAAWQMWQKLRALRHQRTLRERADYLLARNGVSEGLSLCEELARQSRMEATTEYRRWKELVSASHNDKEVLLLYSRLVLSASDARALQRVTSHAGDTAVMVAVSYFPMVDMLLVLWRQLRLIEEVSAAYGLEIGYWGRIELLRKVLRNIAMAGAAEIASEVGAEVLGAGVSAKVSAAFAQGLAAGALTARLGLRAMEACRGIAWEEEQRPRLRQVMGGVVEKAKRFLVEAGSGGN